MLSKKSKIALFFQVISIGLSTSSIGLLISVKNSVQRSDQKKDHMLAIYFLIALSSLLIISLWLNIESLSSKIGVLFYSFIGISFGIILGYKPFLKNPSDNIYRNAKWLTVICGVLAAGALTLKDENNEKNKNINYTAGIIFASCGLFLFITSIMLLSRMKKFKDTIDTKSYKIFSSILLIVSILIFFTGLFIVYHTKKLNRGASNDELGSDFING